MGAYMDNRAVGIFDSGVGGLTAVRALRALLPEEDILYFADTAHVPYGKRSAAELRELSAAAAGLLRSRGVKAILVACGTASSEGMDAVREAGLPCCGVVRAAAREAARISRNGRIGVLSTEATAASGAFARELAAAAPGAEAVIHGTGLLVPLIEAGRCDAGDPDVRAAVAAAAAPFSGSGIDTLILGCTHFPLLSQAFARELGEGVALVDSGAAGARAFAALLASEGLLSEGGGSLRCLVSGDAAAFAASLGRLLPEAAPSPVEKA